MAFKSASELNAMFSKNPQQVQQYLSKAASEGRPAISSDNPGYSKAIMRRTQRFRAPGAPSPDHLLGDIAPPPANTVSPQVSEPARTQHGADPAAG